MNRRELIVGAGAAAVAASIPSVIASPVDLKINIVVVDEVSSVSFGFLDQMAHLWGISRQIGAGAYCDVTNMATWSVETDQHLRDRIVKLITDVVIDVEVTTP